LCVLSLECSAAQGSAGAGPGPTPIRANRLYRLSPGKGIRGYSKDRSEPETSQCQGRSELDGPLDSKPARFSPAHAHAKLRVQGGRSSSDRVVSMVGFKARGR